MWTARSWGSCWSGWRWSPAPSSPSLERLPTPTSRQCYRAVPTVPTQRFQSPNLCSKSFLQIRYIVICYSYLLTIQAGFRIRSDSDLFGRIRKIFTGSVSGSYRYFGYVKLYKKGKNILKIELLHIFRSIFPVFQIKIFIIQISEEICFM